MATKICYQCRTEVDALASICSACRTKLGPRGSNGVAKRYTSPAAWGCLILIIVGAVMGGIGSLLTQDSPATSAPSAPAPPVDPKYGSEPTSAWVKYNVLAHLKQVANDPDSVEIEDVYEPEKVTVKISGIKIDCWRTSFSYRARNGFGALMLYRGHVLTKNGVFLDEKFND
ncbi:MAG TPA: hypothetical protein VFT74_13455 [Isosphaeraceae bacterium]|nr:hypothetical protein [Isosphaeraceae bacterium]